MKRLGNALKIASVYIGTLLGAGFASGQELLHYFAKYGIKGMFGCILSGMLFGFILFITLYLIKVLECRSFEELTTCTMPYKVGRGIQISVMLFMFVIFSTMLAGSGALINESYGGSSVVGMAIMAVLCFIVFMHDIKGIVFVNMVLAPVLLIGTIVLGTYLWINRSIDVMWIVPGSVTVYKEQWIISALIYVAYNIVTALVVICGLREYIVNTATIFWSSFISFVVLSTIGLTLGTVLLIHYDQVAGLDLPLLDIVSMYDGAVSVVYIIVLASAIFTTAIATGFGVISFWLEHFKVSIYKRVNEVVISIFIIIVGISFSFIGFANFVKYVYPIFGYIGLFEIIVIFLYYIKVRHRKY